MRVSQLLPHWHLGASSKSSRNLAEEEATRIIAALTIAVGLFWFMNHLERHRMNRIIEELKGKDDSLDNRD
jgi:heme/copper-type cytochrome/quinol oxidase subunit 4